MFRVFYCVLEPFVVHLSVWGEVRERDHLEDQDIDGSVILKWIFKT